MASSRQCGSLSAISLKRGGADRSYDTRNAALRLNRRDAAMPLHLLKLAVGIEDIEHLRRIRAARAEERGGSWVHTRNYPRRAAEILAGGSIYWIIRGQIRVRQL